MKINKTLLFFIIFILLILISFIIISTYAKYTSSANSNANISIAKWNIKVNNISIKDNTDISETLTPIFPGNSNISSNIIAPTAEGYFDLDFDFQDVDVSFNYTITSSVSEDSLVKDFIITGYSIDDGPRVDLNTNDNKVISDDILLTSNIKSRKIRIYVKWIDDDSETMDNADDTLAAISGTPAKFNVNINFSQIID